MDGEELVKKRIEKLRKDFLEKTKDLEGLVCPNPEKNPNCLGRFWEGNRGIYTPKYGRICEDCWCKIVGDYIETHPIGGPHPPE